MGAAQRSQLSVSGLALFLVILPKYFY